MVVGRLVCSSYEKQFLADKYNQLGFHCKPTIAASDILYGRPTF